MKKVLFVFNGMVKNNGVLSISGGDIRVLEIMKNSPKTVEVYVLSTPNGIDFLKLYKQKYKKAYVIPYKVTAGIASNVLITVKSFFLFRTGVRSFNSSIVYSSSEHIYDVLPALRLKLLNGCEWYAAYHWVEDYPWREKRGDTPFLSRYAYWLNRYIAGWLIKIFANRILAVSPQTKEKLIAIKKIKASRIKAVDCGVDYELTNKVALKYKLEKGRKFDAVYMKRLNYGKGIIDLLKIWQAVVSEKPHAKLGIIGDGSEDVIRKIEEFINKNKLQDNIHLLGVIYDVEEKIRTINSSKIFLLPSHEENWAIVIGEAMAGGVPVVVSRLKEIEPIWQDNVVWCEVGNVQDFAAKTLSLLEDRNARNKLAKKAKEFVKRYDWTEIARTELD